MGARAGVLILASVLVVAACTSAPTAVAAPAPASSEVLIAVGARPDTRDDDPRPRRDVSLPRWPGGADLDRIEAAYVRLAADLAPRETTTFAGPLAMWPVTSRRITSPFGPRWGGFHNGLDIASPMYAPVVAAASGQVVLAGRPYLAYGDTAMIVIVAHAANFATVYVHLDDSRLPPVTAGERVTAGAVIGYVGVTGWTTGPHVHFMTVSNGRAVDPRSYLP
jgi:murein DD-endopeptidase MepM/ murein hydrolase activator NlpD